MSVPTSDRLNCSLGHQWHPRYVGMLRVLFCLVCWRIKR